MTINKTIVYIFLGAILVIGIVGYLEYQKLQRQLNKQRQDYVLQKEKLIEKNVIAFDSIEKLNDSLDALISNSDVITDKANVKREKNKQAYEKAIRNADTISQSNLQRKLSDIFE